MTRTELVSLLKEKGYEVSDESYIPFKSISLLWPVRISSDLKKARLFSSNIFRTKTGNYLPFSQIQPVGDYLLAASFLRDLELYLDPE
jgi:hypothetical protein